MASLLQVTSTKWSLSLFQHAEKFTTLWGGCLVSVSLLIIITELTYLKLPHAEGGGGARVRGWGWGAKYYYVVLPPSPFAMFSKMNLFIDATCFGTFEAS